MTLHLVLLALVAASAFLLAMIRPGRPQYRSLGQVMLAASPFVAIALLTRLVLSVNGIPFLEWLLPLACVLLVGCFCTSNQLFGWYTVGVLVASAVLCFNYVGLIRSGGFTGRPAAIERVWHASEMVAVRSAEAELRKVFPADTDVPEGPVAKLTGNDDYNRIKQVRSRRVWHTWMTGLYAVESRDAIVWCRGGKASTLGDRIIVQ